MGDVVGGLIAIAGVLLICAVPLVLAVLPRPVEEVLTTGSAGGRRGLAIHPDRGHRLLLFVGWIPIGGVLALGVWYLGSSPYAAVSCSSRVRTWPTSAGLVRPGEQGTAPCTLTPAGIYQFWGGSEILVPWDDVRGLVTTPKDLIVETRRRVRPRRSLPLLGGRRSVQRDDAVSLPYRFLPPLPYQEMIELYATSPASRGELSTDEPVERARRLLRDARGLDPQGHSAHE